MPRRCAATASNISLPSESSAFTKVVPHPAREQQSPRLCYNFREFVSETTQAKRYLVSGMVQGVGYRYFAQHAAEHLKVSGFVRNLGDGRVEVFAMGTATQLADLRRRLEKGPPFSSVSAVDEHPATADSQYEYGFVINPSA